MSYAKDVLVETEWVEEHLDDDSIRIVEVDENPALYAEAPHPRRDRLRLEGRPPGPGEARLPRARGLRRADRRAAASPTTTPIVLYGDRNNWFAAYTYWYFRYYGHDDVKLVNGPREKWIAEGRRDDDRGAEPPGGDVHRAARRRRRSAPSATRCTRRSTQTHATSSTCARPQEYSGELIAMAGYEQEGAQRAGHIPGAASVPWAQAVNEDGTFKSADELRELYTAARACSTATPIIAYCRIGERSAHTWFVLHELLGQEDVKNYDGSWTEWGNLVGVPIEKDV